MRVLKTVLKFSGHALIYRLINRQMQAYGLGGLTPSHMCLKNVR